MFLLSIIILTFNNEKIIEKCITNILNSEYKNFELIIVDNNSTDNTRKILSELKINNENVKIILNSINVGYNKGNFIGIQNCNGDYIAIINPDVYIEKNWSKNIMETFSKNSDLIAISGILLNEDGTMQSSGGLIDKYGAVKQRKESDNTEEFFYNPGSAFVFCKSVLSKIQFDPNLFMYYDDVDFAWQARLFGYMIGFCKNSKAVHLEGKSQPGLPPDKFYNICKNRIYVCIKNYSSNRLFRRFIPILFFVIADGIYYSIKLRKIAYFSSSIKGIFWNIKNYSLISKQRNKIQSTRVLNDNEIEKVMEKKSIEFSTLHHMQ